MYTLDTSLQFDLLMMAQIILTRLLEHSYFQILIWFIPILFIHMQYWTPTFSHYVDAKTYKKWDSIGGNI